MADSEFGPIALCDVMEDEGEKMFRIIEVDQAQTWDNIVSTFPQADVFYLNQYARACQLRGEGEPFLFYYEDSKTRGINVVMRRDISDIPHFSELIPAKTYYDLSSPYGYGGFIFEGEDPKRVYHAFDEYCIEQGYISDFVRFNLFGGALKHYSGVIVQRGSNVVRSLDESLSEIEADFDRKVRKNLRKARNVGLEIEIDMTGTQRMGEFLRIYYSTMARAGAHYRYYFPEDYFREINKMMGHFAYFHVLYEGKVISTELVLYGSDSCYSFLGGTDADYFNLRPNDFLKYAVIEWAKEAGLKRYILGGGFKGEDGIFRFKKCFSPTGIVPFFTGHQVFRKEEYDMLLALRGGIPGHAQADDYFPAYRRLLYDKGITTV